MAVKGLGDRKRVSTKITHEEKGQRTERSTNVYLPKKGMKEVAICNSCQLVYQNKHWYLDEAEARKFMADSRIRRGTCPACRRTEDSLPAGIATFSGDYFHGARGGNPRHHQERGDEFKGEEPPRQGYGDIPGGKRPFRFHHRGQACQETGKRGLQGAQGGIALSVEP
jgi:hypothetical protein